ncbi:MAG: site-specific DNA-methyltransferase, partial [Saprospiraceae bacterium]|nr:site-specific DNA-methyltransferase [Saprospiraceae bacterium]
MEVQGNELIIYFTYLPNETGEKQADLNEAAFELIKNNLHKDWKRYILIKAPTEANKDRTLIEKHINDFTARNTFDYFIHKDIGTFLRRELDFFIKNEILFLEDIDLKNPKKYLAQLTKMNAIRKVADKVIIFLEQLENFQKKLWLKKKFVVETNYCITLDKIPESYYAEIAENEAQWTTWETLFAISEINKDELSGAEIPRLEFIKHQPFLVLDTQYFSTDFKNRLLAEFEDLEAETDGLLINSENFQALNLLQERYKEEIRCIYIDPPYNTGDDGFVYKDIFKHSSWLSMFENRMRLARNLINQDGWVAISIDEREYHRMVTLISDFFGEDNFRSTITVKMSHLSGMKMSHVDNKPPKIKEYLVIVSNSESATLSPVYEKSSWNDALDRYNGFLVKDKSDENNETLWRRITIREYAL